MLAGINISDSFIKYLSHRFNVVVKDCSLTEEDKYEKIDFYVDGVPIQFKSRTSFTDLNLEVAKYLPYTDKIVSGRDTKIKAKYLIFFSEILPYFSIIPIESIQTVISHVLQNLFEKVDIKITINNRTKPNHLLYKDSTVTVILHRDSNHHGVLYKIVAYCPLEAFTIQKFSFNGDLLMYESQWKEYKEKETFAFNV